MQSDRPHQSQQQLILVKGVPCYSFRHGKTLLPCCVPLEEEALLVRTQVWAEFDDKCLVEVRYARVDERSKDSLAESCDLGEGFLGWDIAEDSEL